jgi:acetyl esterase/lipase
VFADLQGLPPLLIQAGSNELLLDDAVRLAGRAAADDTPVTLEVTPGVPHLFQAFAAILEEGDAALNRVTSSSGRHSGRDVRDERQCVRCGSTPRAAGRAVHR